MPRGKSFDYERASTLLVEVFTEAEGDFRARSPAAVSAALSSAFDIMFASSTQAYREVLVGSALARLVDPTRNLRKPYVKQGDDAYNGRTLDERVVNPFLHEHTVPSSKAPFLSAFRRNIEFVPETARGLRDREGYAAFLEVIEALSDASPPEARTILRHLLYRFVQLRDAANITLAQVRRLSLDQNEALIDGLLATPSGGLLPVLLVVALFRTLSERFGLGWIVTCQGINVADSASGAGGDVTVQREGRLVLAVEVTERPLDRSRVVSTFNTKISPQSIEDYLFLTTAAAPPDEAKAAARQYFAQGHEMGFLHVKPWLVNSLGTLGPTGRATFTTELLKLLGSQDTPASAKLAWNEQVKALFG